MEEARRELAQWTDVIAIPGDVSDPLHRNELAQAAEEMGGLDALVNNASSLGPSPMPRLLEYPLDELEAVFQVNLFAILGLLQELQTWIKPKGRVINVTSDAGVEPYEGWGGYGSSKAALEQLSAILAQENPQWQVYWVDPGDMRTQMHQDAFPGEDISDRPLPKVSVPVFIALVDGELPGGRYQVQAILAESA